MGSSKPHLASDATVIYNPFSGYYEAFAIMNDGHLQRSWQKGGTGWSDWRSMGKEKYNLCNIQIRWKNIVLLL